MSAINKIRRELKKIELRLIKTYLYQRKLKQEKIKREIGKISIKHFYDKDCRHIFKRINTSYIQDNELPSIEVLKSDLSLSDPQKKLLDIIKRNKVKIIKQNSEFQKLLKTHSDYVKVLKGVEKAKNILEKITEYETIKVDNILSDIRELSNIIEQDLTASKEEFLVLGKSGDNSLVKEMIEEAIEGNEEKDTNFIPTGFQSFDTKNGGFFYGSLVVLGATTGGGKTTIAMQILLNMAKFGFNGLYVSLEMDRKELLNRILANISNIPNRKLFLKKLTEEEAKQIRKAYNKFIKENDGSITIFSPKEDINIEQALQVAKNSNIDYDVIVIDYLTLLADADGEQQWKILSNIARICKRFAQATNKIVILLVQITEELKVRYSKAIKDHADNVWFWKYEEKDRESGIIQINQVKARNQTPFPFEVKEEFEYSRVVDFNDNGHDDLEDAKEEVEEILEEEMEDILNEFEED